MRRTLLVGSLAAIACVTPLKAQQAAAKTDADREAVLAVVQKLFDSVRARDPAAILSVFDRTGRLLPKGFRDGHAALVPVTPQDFARIILGRDRIVDERIYDPEVRVDDDLATVWAYYEQYHGNQFSHCGLDSIQLFRASGEWKITQIADTRRTENCLHRKRI